MLDSIEESESEEDLEVAKIIGKLMKFNPFEKRGKKRCRKVLGKEESYSENKRPKKTQG